MQITEYYSRGCIWLQYHCVLCFLFIHPTTTAQFFYFIIAFSSHLDFGKFRKQKLYSKTNHNRASKEKRSLNTVSASTLDFWMRFFSLLLGTSIL
jgi:hypothetical protein